MNRSIRKELDLVFKAQQEMTKTSIVIEEIQNFNKSCIITAISHLKSGTWTEKCKMSKKDAMSSRHENKTDNFLEKGNL